jgi:hypothetical protein
VAQPVTGPFLSTFTFRLPFVLGVADCPDHEVALPVGYANEDDAGVFGERPYVRVRDFNAPISDFKFWPVNMPVAVHHFYQGDIGAPHAEGVRLYEQWTSLETPAVFLVGERQTDPAYAFHRSVGALNLFLQAFALARVDDLVRPVSTREMRPIVTVGRLTLAGRWEHVGAMLMHPDAKERPLSSRSVEVHLTELNRATDAIRLGDPFVRARQWRARAERRKYEGDAADSIVSFQIAVENLAYQLWGMLLVDEGLTSKQIEVTREADTPYKSVLTRELAGRLGGSWDLTKTTTPVGRYWRDLYGLRNRIIHAAYLPHDGDAGLAEVAFADFDKFIDDRLRATRNKYPRSFLAKVGQKALEDRGWANKAVRAFIAQAGAEPLPFYLPRDIAGR